MRVAASEKFGANKHLGSKAGVRVGDFDFGLQSVSLEVGLTGDASDLSAEGLVGKEIGNEIDHLTEGEGGSFVERNVDAGLKFFGIVEFDDGCGFWVIHVQHAFLSWSGVKVENDSVDRSANAGAVEGQLGAVAVGLENGEFGVHGSFLSRELGFPGQELCDSGFGFGELGLLTFVSETGLHDLLLGNGAVAEFLKSGEVVECIRDLSGEGLDVFTLRVNFSFDQIEAGAMSDDLFFKAFVISCGSLEVQAGVFIDEGGEEVASFDGLAFKGVDFFDHSIDQSGDKNDVGIRLDPAGSLEKEGAFLACGLLILKGS